MNPASSTRRAFLRLNGGLIAATGLAQAAPLDDPALSAREILARMAAAYANCASYQDTGRVTTAIVGGDAAGHTDTLSFSTAFVRPARFRFEFTARRGSRFLAVAHGEDSRTWWDVQPGIQRPPSLELALAGAAGISRGAAHTVPALLMPDRVGGARLTDLIELRRLPDARLGEVDCFCIEGASLADRNPELQERIRQQVLQITGKDFGLARHGPDVVWIARATFLLHRIDKSIQHATHRSDTTTTYVPVLDAAITDRQLAFDPPAR